MTPVFLKELIPVTRARLIKHSRFAPDSFFSRANDKIEIYTAFVNPKIDNNSIS